MIAEPGPSSLVEETQTSAAVEDQHAAGSDHLSEAPLPEDSKPVAEASSSAGEGVSEVLDSGPTSRSSQPSVDDEQDNIETDRMLAMVLDHELNSASATEASDRAILERLSSLPSSRRLLSLSRSLLGISFQGELDDDKVFEGHLRIQKLLHECGLVEKVIAGDGNCQFAALSDQLYGTPRHADQMRKLTVAYLGRNAQRYAPFVQGDFQAYLKRMKKSGEWGDNITLQAASDMLGIRINLISSYETGVLQVEPQEIRSQRILWLSFFAEIHYNSVYHDGDHNALAEAQKETKKCIIS